MRGYQKIKRFTAALLCFAMLGGFFTVGPLTAFATDDEDTFTKWNCIDVASASTSSKYALARTYGGSTNTGETIIAIEFDLVHTWDANAFIVFDGDDTASSTNRPVWLGIRQAAAQNDFSIFTSSSVQASIAGITPSTDYDYHIKMVVDLSNSKYDVYITELAKDRQTTGNTVSRTGVGYRGDTNVIAASGISAMYFYKPAVAGTTDLDYIKNLFVNGEPQGTYDATDVNLPTKYGTAEVTGSDMILYKDINVGEQSVTAKVAGLEFADSLDKSRFTFTDLPTGVTIASVTRDVSDKSKATIALSGSPDTAQEAASIGTLSIDASQLKGTYNNPGPTSDVTSAESAVTVTVLSEVQHTTGVALNQSTLTLQEGQTQQLTATLTPANSVDSVEWSSSDPAVTVSADGLVTAVSVGSAVITATSNGHSDTCAVTVTDYTPDEFDLLRERYRGVVVPDWEDVSDEYLLILKTNAAHYWETLNIAEKDSWNKTTILPWKDTDFYVSTDASTGAHLSRPEHSEYYRYFLRAMAFAYLSPDVPGQPSVTVNGVTYDTMLDNPVLLEHIIEVIKFVDKYWYKTTYATGAPSGTSWNWWHREIGFPIYGSELLLILGDALPEELVANQLTNAKAIMDSANFSASGYVGGANQLDKSRAMMLYGILAKDAAMIKKACAWLDSSAFTIPVATAAGGNGFYYDGTFIQHTNLAYNTAYGLSFLGSVSFILYVMAGVDAITDLDGNDVSIVIDPAQLKVLFNYVDISFLSTMWQGINMDVMGGRSISRSHQSDRTRGIGLTEALYLLAAYRPDLQADYHGYIKYWYSTNPGMGEVASPFFHAVLRDIAADDAIIAKDSPNRVSAMNRGARLLNKTGDYMAAIAMHSGTRAVFERGNGENLYGHYTHDGAFYLYRGYDQYSGGYWGAVDYARIPGTTIDTDTIADLYYENNASTGVRLNTNVTVAGSSALGEYSATAFSANHTIAAPSLYNSNLKANKSYFVLGEKIIFVGSGITGTTGDAMTVAENRMLADSAASNRFVVNGDVVTLDTSGEPQKVYKRTADTVKTTDVGTEQWGKLKTVTGEDSWAFLQEGTVANLGIGYFFPGEQTLKVGKVYREADWNLYRTVTAAGTMAEGSFAQLLLQHGNNPADETYVYVTFPNTTEAAVSAYDGSDFVVLAQTNTLHAIYDSVTDIVAVNNFATSSVTFDSPFGSITINTAATVMIGRSIAADGTVTYEVVISDPRPSNATSNFDITVAIDSMLALVSYEFPTDQEALDATKDRVTVAAADSKVSVTARVLKTGTSDMYRQNQWYATVEMVEPEVTSFAPDFAILPSEGGEVTLIAKGEHLNWAVGGLSVSDGSAVEAMTVTATEGTITFTVAPNTNTTDEVITFTLIGDLLGNEIPLEATVTVLGTAAELPVPAIVSIDADPASLPKEGGEVVITVTSEYLNFAAEPGVPNTVSVKCSDDTEEALTLGDKMEFVVDLPANTGSSGKSYTFTVWFNGVATSKRVTVTVAGSGNSGNAVTDNTLNPNDIKETDEGTVKIELTDKKNVLNDAAMAKVIELNGDKPVVISGDSVSIVIPAGTLSAGADVNAMIVDTKQAQSGNVIKVTLPDGTEIILPFAVVGDGTAVYIASVEGVYEIVDNSKTFGDQASIPEWADNSVGFVTSHEFFLGNDKGEFDGSTEMTRSTIVAVLGRIGGAVLGENAESPFSDMPAGHWAAPYVAWGAAMGIVQGDGVHFNGDDNVTREQLCVMLDRFVTSLGIRLPEAENDESILEKYGDLSCVNEWARDSVILMIRLGIITGKPGGLVDPQSGASRYEIAVILERFINAVISAI